MSPNSWSSEGKFTLVATMSIRNKAVLITFWYLFLVRKMLFILFLRTSPPSNLDSWRHFRIWWNPTLLRCISCNTTRTTQCLKTMLLHNNCTKTKWLFNTFFEAIGPRFQTSPLYVRGGPTLTNSSFDLFLQTSSPPSNTLISIHTLLWWFGTMLFYWGSDLTLECQNQPFFYSPSPRGLIHHQGVWATRPLDTY